VDKTLVKPKASTHSSTSVSRAYSFNAVSQLKILSSSNKASAPEGLFAPRGDVRIVVINDLNSQYGSTSYEPEVARAITLIPDWQPDLVVGEVI